MSVKKLLAQQEGGFISLHEILTKMMALDESSYQECAKVLYRLLHLKMPDELFEFNPSFYVNDPLKGVERADVSGNRRTLECLRQAALYGRPSLYDEDDLPF